MTHWYKAYKPAAPASVHLLLAAMMWTVVGTALVFFGFRWERAGHLPYLSLLLAAAVGVGLLKSRLVLDRAAGRLVERISRRGDGRCIGGFLSWRTWLLVAFMMGCGRLLRGGLLPLALVGWVYAAVGTALLVSARALWGAWYQHRSLP